MLTTNKSELNQKEKIPHQTLDYEKSNIDDFNDETTQFNSTEEERIAFIAEAKKHFDRLEKERLASVIETEKPFD